MSKPAIGTPVIFVASTHPSFPSPARDFGVDRLAGFVAHVHDVGADSGGTLVNLAVLDPNGRFHALQNVEFVPHGQTPSLPHSFCQPVNG